MLLEKNKRYGDSALQPTNIGGVTVPAETGILIRIHDKLRRWSAAVAGEDEDIVLDLLGYLILLRIARKNAAPRVTP